MKEFKIKDYTFRIKEMNAIEALAFKTQINFDSFNNALELYNLVLERIEVKCGEKWLPVKDGNIYYPNEIEKDIKSINEILNNFLEYLKELF